MFALQLKEPIFGEVLRLNGAFFLRGYPPVLHSEVSRVLPMSTVFTLVEVEFSSRKNVVCHSDLVRNRLHGCHTAHAFDHVGGCPKWAFLCKMCKMRKMCVIVSELFEEVNCHVN